MPPHRIHLRRAWESDLGRIDLPASWSVLTAPTRLWRRFNRPPCPSPQERVSLVFERVPGLLSASLNGRSLGPVPRDVLWEIPVEDWLSRANLIELLVDPQLLLSEASWGSIALVIRHVED